MYKLVHLQRQYHVWWLIHLKKIEATVSISSPSSSSLLSFTSLPPGILKTQLRDVYVLSKWFWYYDLFFDTLWLFKKNFTWSQWYDFIRPPISVFSSIVFFVIAHWTPVPQTSDCFSAVCQNLAKIVPARNASWPGWNSSFSRTSSQSADFNISRVGLCQLQFCRWSKRVKSEYPKFFN